MEAIAQYIDLSKTSLWLSAATIFFNPSFWCLVGTTEHKYRWFSKLVGGNKYVATYIFAVIVFSLGVFRDYKYHEALIEQPTLSGLPLNDSVLQIIASALYIIGTTLVLASFYRLGIDGTYLGDYFGILKTEKLSGFPFNVDSDPMYLGSSLNFLAHAIWLKSPAGLALSVFVFVIYKFYSITIEGPFTDYIYSSAAKAAQQKDAKKQKKAKNH